MKKPPAFTRGFRVPPLAYYLKITPQAKANAIKALREFERRQQTSKQEVSR